MPPIIAVFVKCVQRWFLQISGLHGPLLSWDVNFGEDNRKGKNENPKGEKEEG
jgi:hypothetical protein